jgi:glycosyltransferase involved in cell wall biosynthesis
MSAAHDSAGHELPSHAPSMKVVHMTSVHARNDVRILLKECASLQSAGHDVRLLVADGQGDGTASSVRIIDVGLRSRRRLARASLTGWRMYRAARRQRADVYHLHDPELLPWAVLLRMAGYRVVYDAHEHLADDILAKPYLSAWMMRMLVATAAPGELFMARRMSAVVAATPAILKRFSERARISVGVYNFPLEHELTRGGAWSYRKPQACYVGGVSVSRGVRELIMAAQFARTRIVIAGPLWDGLTEQTLSSVPGWNKVSYVGSLGRQVVGELMASSRVGLVTFLPTRSHVDSMPNKLFEYMSAGIPVVASNFPLWQSVVDRTGSGLCIDPTDPQAIAEAIDRLAEDDEFAARCGRNGMRAVTETYNWNGQAAKLIALYGQLAAPPRD